MKLLLIICLLATVGCTAVQRQYDRWIDTNLVAGATLETDGRTATITRPDGTVTSHPVPGDPAPGALQPLEDGVNTYVLTGSVFAALTSIGLGYLEMRQRKRARTSDTMVRAVITGIANAPVGTSAQQIVAATVKRVAQAAGVEPQLKERVDDLDANVAAVTPAPSTQT